MKVSLIHRWLGVPLGQLATDARCRLLEDLRYRAEWESLFLRINGTTDLVLKCAPRPVKPPAKVFEFRFDYRELAAIKSRENSGKRVLAVFVCGAAFHIGVINASELDELVLTRLAAMGIDEDLYRIYVAIPRRGDLGVFVHRRGSDKAVGQPLFIQRDVFPDIVFR